MDSGKTNSFMLLSPVVFPFVFSNYGFSTENYNASDSSEKFMVVLKVLNVHNYQHKVTENSIPLHENSFWPSQRPVLSGLGLKLLNSEYEQMAMNDYTE